MSLRKQLHLFAVVMLISTTSFFVGLWYLTPVQASPDADCDHFGEMQDGEPLYDGFEGAVRTIFQNACMELNSVVGEKKSDVHWWEGLLVQDFYGESGHAEGAIFYDINVHWGGGKAYVLWGPVLERYWGSSQWGPPVSHRVEAWSNPDTGHGGHLVRFNDLDVYYHNETGETYVVRGVTRDRYNALGGSGGFLGFPNSEGMVAADSGCSGVGGWYQYFEGGIMHTFSLDGVHWQAFEVQGAIQATYNSLPGTGSGSALGFPVSGEIDTPPSAVNPDKKGVYQNFECGRIYYDAKGPGGVTYTLYKSVIDKLSVFYNESNVDNPDLGFPIGKMTGPGDCRAYFEAGYVDCNTGIHVYDNDVPHPPLPDFDLPYAQGTVAYWTGGPHAYGRGIGVQYYDSGNGTGSGIDFANGHFNVKTLTGGTVVDVNATNCADNGDLGCYVAIRSDYGGTVIVYGHLQTGSVGITRENEKTGQTETFAINPGMYVGKNEQIGMAGSSGTDAVHLHLELLDGTGRDCPNGWVCFLNGQHHFGQPISWDGAHIGNYTIYDTQSAQDESKWMNYEGTAVRDDSGTKIVDISYTDNGVVVTTHAKVSSSFPSCTDHCWNNDLDPQVTVFSSISSLGCLGGCRDINDETPGELLSESLKITYAFDPDNKTLFSPEYGLYARVYIPFLINIEEGHITPTPEPTPVFTPTIIPPPNDVDFLGPFLNNGGFEYGNFSGWQFAGKSFDLTTDDASSGSWSVRGTSYQQAYFYRDVSTFDYAYWINHGLATAVFGAQFDPGKSEEYKFQVRFFDSANNDLGSGFDYGWAYHAGDWAWISGERSVPEGTSYIRLIFWAQRFNGDYTDVNVDDVTLTLEFQR